MAVVNRTSVAEPTLPKETVEVQSIGGDVVVRGLLLTERLSLSNRIARLRAAQIAGDAKAEVDAVLPTLLAVTVLASDGEPLWTEAQWQIFGGQHQAQALALFNVAWRLSGFVQAEETKN